MQSLARVGVRTGFTLVEILIVVVILGILSALVVPQFAAATSEAKGGNLGTQLSQLQRQIDFYHAKNGSQYPDFAGQGWNPLISGGYIKAAPTNPAFTGAANQRSLICTSPGATEQGCGSAGWAWNAATGTMWASNYDEATGKVVASPTE